MTRDQENRKALRRMQFTQYRGALLIFLGCILMQLPAYIICVLGYLALQIFQGTEMGHAQQNMARMMSEGGGDLLIWVSAVSAGFCLIWCGALYRRSSWRQDGFSYREAFRGGRIPAVCGACSSACVLLTLFITLLAAAVPDWFTSYQQVMSQLDYHASVITLPYILLIGPASEELIFRGAMFDRFRLALPFWGANLLQAACFGIYHMNLIQGLYAFLLGILLGVVYQVTGSVLGSILAHVVFNLTSQLLSVCFTGRYAWEPAGMVVLLLVSVIVAVFSVRYLLHSLDVNS